MRTLGLIIAVAACGGCSARPTTGPGDDGPPRLLAPQSLATVTQRQPTLRWTSLGDGMPVVDLCRDRACAMPLPVGTVLAADHLSAVPVAALPPGWVFWRVRTFGAPAITTATWQFWVGASSASNPVDTSSGAILDVDGDGHADVLVGDEGFNSPGAAHLYLGSATPGAADWNGTAAARRIDLVSPDGASTQFGAAVTSAGDVNGDGYADFLIGTNNAGSAPGAVHLYLGGPAPQAADWNGVATARRIDLVNPDGADSAIGRAIAAAGDVNGDGYADFLVSSARGPVADPSVVLYLGSAAPRAVDWADAAKGQRLRLAMWAFALAGAGDVNGDGYGDFLVGTASSDLAAVHLYLGSASPRAADWGTGTSSARIDLNNPDGANAEYGTVLASAGDVNGDGYADFLIGAPGDTTMVSRSGNAHLYLGAAAPASTDWSGSAPVKRIDLVNSDSGVAVFGGAVAGAGDVNADGYADFVVGAAGATQSTNGGAAHLYLGATSPGTAWNGASPAGRIDLVNPSVSAVAFGHSAGGGGDVNGDGYADFAVGGFGAVFVHLGTAAPGAITWAGPRPATRIDVTRVTFDAAGGGFGNAVASADPGGAPRPATADRSSRSAYP